ncbi:RICIN domain-containing protein [Streptomyces sp. NPDC099088]|uniref:RICIN domain-containing protein n=1 Tax=Streptomyces sp. NPDC099088 TaxID=3366101 RepID=UPI003815FA82
MNLKHISADHSGKFLAVAKPFGASAAKAGDKLVQVTADVREAQWIIKSLSGNLETYQLRDKIKASNGSLVPGCIDTQVTRENNVPIIIQPCDGSESQKWEYVYSGGGTYQIRNHSARSTNMYWHVLNASNLENMPLVQFLGPGGANSKFHFSNAGTTN